MNEKEIKNGKIIFFESDDDILEIWFSEKLNKFCRMFNAELKTWATFSPCLKDVKRLINEYSLIEQIQTEEFEIMVWFRYVIAGEQEKEYDIHKIAAVDVQDAVNKAELLYPSRARIPFAYYHNEIKYQPQN